MESLPTGYRDLDLRAVRVRPTRGAQEHRRWDRLVATHHYLSFQGLFGQALRHVATLGAIWIALLGWQAAALKLTARDRWIGWSPQQKRRRLHLVTQNSRFMILPGFHARNLASRVLGLSLRRLSDDMLAAHGCPVLLAETFVDPARFAGTCYRAANWRSLGLTGGYARQPGAAPTWRHHGQPKEILVFELQPDAAATLRQPADEPAWQGPARSAPPDTPQLRSLFEFLGRCRSTVTRAASATVCAPCSKAVAGGWPERRDGLRAVRRPAEPAATAGGGLFLQPQPAMLHDPVATFHNILAPPEGARWGSGPGSRASGADKSLRMRQIRTRGGGREGPRERSRRRAGRRSAWTAPRRIEADRGAAACWSRPWSRAAAWCWDRSLPQARSRRCASGRAGPHRAHGHRRRAARHKTAHCLLDSCGADYVMDNQPTMLADLRGMDFSACPTCETLDKEHGRIDLPLLAGPQRPGMGRLCQTDAGGENANGCSRGHRSDACPHLAGRRASGNSRHWSVAHREPPAYVRDADRAAADLAQSRLPDQHGDDPLPARVDVPEAHFAARPQEAVDLLLAPVAYAPLPPACMTLARGVSVLASNRPRCSGHLPSPLDARGCA